MTEQRLLILDDDAMIGQMISYIATSMGMAAQTTTTAEAFFEMFETWQPNRIALDLVMPDMDGVQVLAELAQRRCQAHIIITSGVGPRVLDAARRSAREHGLSILGVLSKPFSPTTLRQLLLQTPDGRPFRQPTRSEEQDAPEQLGVDEVAEAINNDELSLVYQPKVHCKNGLLHGFEALVRWHSPRRGPVAPGHFIPIAEANGLMEGLTSVVIDQSLRWYAEELIPAVHSTLGSSRSDEEMPNLSINLSARTLGDASFVERVASACQQMAIPPQQLIFELTETSAMEDPVASLDLLTRLRMKGFQLSIDDFGTGFSSMLQLVRLPFSEIKVDRSFVMTARSSEESRAVIRSIVELGHSLGLRTTAEGVEDAEALKYLTDIGCDLAQGFYISRPLSPADAITWVRQGGQ
jgi:EAL domain-containing protein (putative c-di-GMP-specific phosphodiesterase class I)/FixJ family two-component response regulator